MKKSRKFISMPIISIVEGVQIGSVKDLVVDPKNLGIAAIVIDQKGWFKEQKIIPYNKVTSVGEDAITIDQSANVEKSTNLPEILKLLRENTDPIGMKVISEKGKVIGQVDEYFLDEATGKITSLEISGRFIESLIKGRGVFDASMIITMGTDAIVVKTGTEQEVTKVDGGLQETFTNIKEGTSSLWNSTKERTLKISKSLNKTIKEKAKDPRKSGFGSASDEQTPPTETLQESDLKESAATELGASELDVTEPASSEMDSVSVETTETTEAVIYEEDTATPETASAEALDNPEEEDQSKAG